MNFTEASPFAFPENVQVALKPDGWTRLATSFDTVISSILQIRLSFILLGCFILAAVYTTKKQSNSLYFTHLDGRKMRMFPHDTRYLRFTHGYVMFSLATYHVHTNFNRKELSKDGEALCGTEPYLVKNKSTVELVLFHPNQVRDFFKEDARCTYKLKTSLLLP